MHRALFHFYLCMTCDGHTEHYFPQAEHFVVQLGLALATGSSSCSPTCSPTGSPTCSPTCSSTSSSFIMSLCLVSILASPAGTPWSAWGVTGMGWSLWSDSISLWSDFSEIRSSSKHAFFKYKLGPVCKQLLIDAFRLYLICNASLNND